MSWPQLCSKINTPSSASSSRRASRRIASAPAQHQRVEHARMIAGQERQRPRQGHHHVFVFNRQKIGLHLVGPEKPLIRAALRAMPIFTAMEHLHFLPAPFARPVVRAQHLRAADQQLAQHPILLHGQLLRLPAAGTPDRRRRITSAISSAGVRTSSHASDSRSAPSRVDSADAGEAERGARDDRWSVWSLTHGRVAAEHLRQRRGPHRWLLVGQGGLEVRPGPGTQRLLPTWLLAMGRAGDHHP